MKATHEVLNQSAPLAGANLWEINRPLRDALAHQAPGLDTGKLAGLGRLAGAMNRIRLSLIIANQLREIFSV